MKTLGQIAHEAGKFDRQWHHMGESQKADWERIAQAVIEAQQVAVPMSDDEMWSLWNQQGIDEMTQPQAIEFARAIEAHHKITPQGDKP